MAANRISMGQHLVGMDVTIPIGTALSDAAAAEGMSLIGISMPDGWDAAAITFASSADRSDYDKTVDTTGTESSIAVPVVDTYIKLDPPYLIVQSLKIRSGTAAAPVNQTAARTLRLVFLNAVGS